MIDRRELLSLLSMLALLLGLALPAAARPGGKPKPPPQPKQPQHKPPNKPQVPPTAPGALQFVEADALRKAFVALAAGNHDYDGHRWKAMRKVKAALGPLNSFVLKHGTAELKVATAQGVKAIEVAEAAASKAPTLHEPQPASDALLRQARVVLLEVRPVLVANKQQHVLGHVNGAISEINVALKIR